ncbi:hypothetical protein QBC44DRAFT_387848 [Cladorrhinum sp. PSN332]|nr:hypothetical protein QBC44DRAFT_387848 [Cladorrhinum sp. PSN332]
MLMKEFSEQLEQIDSALTALEGFIYGYWRRRIRDLYKENYDEVEAMKRTLNQVRTYVLPDRLNSFFRGALHLLDEEEDGKRYKTEYSYRDGEQDSWIEAERLCRFGGYCKYCEDI